MHADEHGTEGEVLVLIHGNVPPDSLLPLAELLASSHRVLLVHRPPFGASASLRSASALETCELLLDALSARGAERFHLSGHSYGAYLALQIALLAPERVRRLSLLAPIARVAPEDIPLFEGGAAAIRAGQDLTDTLALRWVAQRYLESHPEVVEVIRSWQETERAALADDILQAAKVPDLTARLPSLRLPCLVPVGAHDVAAPPEAGRLVAEAIPDAVLEVVDEVGHLLALEDAEGTARSLRAFHRAEAGR